HNVSFLRAAHGAKSSVGSAFRSGAVAGQDGVAEHAYLDVAGHLVAVDVGVELQLHRHWFGDVERQGDDVAVDLSGQVLGADLAGGRADEGVTVALDARIEGAGAHRRVDSDLPVTVHGHIVLPGSCCPT